ncbi:MerR family transcriptional regulator [Peribacillus butanolivorans]|uniref:DNA-binding protein n=1 Tax=Peribacillus butanolivorans TaxID=421767 RepID=UPI0036896356
MVNSKSFGYFSKDVALELKITTSSLRRWSIDLEKLGYTFERNEKEQRIYYERDFKALRELKKLLANNVAFADAVKAVVSMNLEGKNAVKSPRVFTDEIRLSKSELEELIHKTVKKAIEEEREIMFQGFEMKMNDAVEKRDRLLTTQMRKNLDEKAFEIAAAKEENKKKWWKFWD